MGFVMFCSDFAIRSSRGAARHDLLDIVDKRVDNEMYFGRIDCLFIYAGWNGEDLSG